MIYYCELIFDEKNGGYEVHFHDFECCCTQGDNMEHALNMACEALNCILRGRLEDGFRIPSPTDYSRKENYYPIEVDESIARRIMESKKALKKVSV